MKNHLENSDLRIDQILNALRDTESPTGLEARIAAHIANAAEVRPVTASYFAVILNAVKDPHILFAEGRFYTLAATALTLLLALSLFALYPPHKPRTIAQSNPLPLATAPQTLPQRITLVRVRPTAQVMLNKQQQPASSLPPSPIILTDPVTPTDLDAIALAETLAPSRPAPPMPLTQQERLMLSVLHSGDQEEIAALNPVERDALFARDQAAFQNFFAPPAPAPPTLAASISEAKTGDKE